MLKVIAALPDDAAGAPRALMVGTEAPGPTGDDRTFWVTDSAWPDARIVEALSQAERHRRRRQADQAVLQRKRAGRGREGARGLRRRRLFDPPLSRRPGRPSARGGGRGARAGAGAADLRQWVGRGLRPAEPDLSGGRGQHRHQPVRLRRLPDFGPRLSGPGQAGGRAGAARRPGLSVEPGQSDRQLRHGRGNPPPARRPAAARHPGDRRSLRRVRDRAGLGERLRSGAHGAQHRRHPHLLQAARAGRSAGGLWLCAAGGGAGHRPHPSAVQRLPVRHRGGHRRPGRRSAPESLARSGGRVAAAPDPGDQGLRLRGLSGFGQLHPDPLPRCETPGFGGAGLSAGQGDHRARRRQLWPARLPASDNRDRGSEPRLPGRPQR
uniref:Transposase n=1 Tax=Parastrongyloides trichosuri TaxID=131310 RepID=A0A0N4ZDX9_PARTI